VRARVLTARGLGRSSRARYFSAAILPAWSATSIGRQFAIGTATSWYVGPTQDVADGHFAPAVVVLYHLGFWNSKPAYTGYNWYFPQKGNTYGATVKPCKA
jgi:hypothetical protein